MLANLLPGLRFVRTPIVTGYLYLALIWLWFGEQLTPSVNDPGLAGRVATTAAWLGGAAVLTVISFTAYMLGSILTVTVWPSVKRSRIEKRHSEDDAMNGYRGEPAIRAWVRQTVAGLGQMTYRQVQEATTLPVEFRASLQERWTIQQLERAAIAAGAGSDAEGLLDVAGQGLEDVYKASRSLSAAEFLREADKIVHNTFEALGISTRYLDDALDSPVPRESIWAALSRSVDVETNHAMGRLRVESESLFNEFDRMRSEAELRYSIVPPLVAVCVSLAVLFESIWPLLPIAGAAILLRQGLRSAESASDVIDSALLYGVVESQTTQTLKLLATRGLPEVEPHDN